MVDIDNALIRIEDLKKLIKETEVDVSQTKIKAQLEDELKTWEKKIKNKKTEAQSERREPWDELKSFNEWIDNAHAWFMSFHDTPLSTIITSQLAFFLFKSIFVFTPLYPLSYIYDFSLVSMLSVQGELWENGIGRFINLTDNSYYIKSILLLLSLFSLISYSIIEDKKYECFILNAFVIIFFINTFMPRWIYYLTSLFKYIIEFNQNPYEVRYSSYKYGYHLLHLPIITIVFSMLAGWISLSLTNFFDSSTYTTLSFKQAIGPFE